MPEDIFEYGQPMRLPVYQPKDDAPRRKSQERSHNAREMGKALDTGLLSLSKNQKRFCLAGASIMAVLFVGNIIIAGLSSDLKALRAHSLNTASNATFGLAIASGGAAWFFTGKRSEDD